MSKDINILIIDDEPSTVDLVTAFLEDDGFRNVFSETDSRFGMATIRTFKPDMILLDIGMPHVDGFDLLEQIVADPDLRDILVLMLSSAGEAEEQKSYELGALGFLPKPYTSKQVQRIVSSSFRIANRFGLR